MSTPNTSSRSAPLDALLVERLGDDRGAGDGDDRAGEEALDGVHPNSAADEEAEPDHHAASRMTRDEPGGRADPHQLAQAELQAEREHQQDHAQLGERADVSSSATSGIGMCGPTMRPARR